MWSLNILDSNSDSKVTTIFFTFMLSVETKAGHHPMIHDCGGVEACGGVLWSVGECDEVCLSDEMKCDGWSEGRFFSLPYEMTSHFRPKKSKKSKNPPPNFFFSWPILLQKC